MEWCPATVGSRTERFERTMVRSVARFTVVLGLALVHAPLAWADTCGAWESWASTRGAGDDAMPDFSRAGYQRGEVPVPDVKGPVFSVTDYGATGNDDSDDQSGIQKAIDAAARAGGGVVFFPSGTYRLWTTRGNVEPIRVRSSGIVLRGATGPGPGAVLHFVHPGLAPGDFKVPKTGAEFSALKYLVQVQAPGADDEGGEKNAVDLFGEVAKGADGVTVQGKGSFKAGDWVLLSLKTRDQVPSLLAGLTAPGTWGRVTAGVSLMALHQVKQVDGARVTFHEPLPFPVLKGEKASLTPQTMIEGVGIEDLTFRGNWYGRFVHHQTGLDDEGWDAVLMERVVHGWIRRCRFLNVNTAAYLKRSAYGSLLENRIAGTPGHYGVTLRSESRGILSGLSSDEAGACHGPSIGNRSGSIVYWRWRLLPGASIDSHANQPLSTLFDRIDGGTFTRSGGPESAFPHHLKGLVFWNFDYQGDEEQPIDFWSTRKGAGSKFVKPWVVGMTGKPVSFVAEHVMLQESIGKRVEPESLYEAQLALRLGLTPSWVAPARRSWEVTEAKPLDTFSCRGRWLAADRPILFPQTFSSADLVGDLQGQMSALEKSAPGEIRRVGESVRIRSDYQILRRLLEDSVYFVSGGSCHAEISCEDAGPGATFTVRRTGEGKGKTPAEYTAKEIPSEIQDMAFFLGARATVAKDVVTISIPSSSGR